MLEILSYLKQQLWVKTLLDNANVYLVGGCVRDSYLNKPTKDIDIVVEGLTLPKIQHLLFPFGKINIVGESFLVIKFKPTGYTGEDFDIAIPRQDKKIGSGHKGFKVVTENVTIIEDLKRRDFTINSIAINIQTSQILDPYNGIDDIKNKILKATDKAAFAEDPLRIIRAIQFASRFKFNIEPNTLKLMQLYVRNISEISGERIRGEFDKIILKKGSTKTAFDLIERSNLDRALFGTKFYKNGLEYFDHLDMVSFYFVLGNLGRTNSAKFYRERLKGEAPIIKALDTLEKYFSEFNDEISEQEKRWNVFLMLKMSPHLINAVVLPEDVSKIIDQMKAGEIPMKMGDIPVTGNDIMDKFGVKDKEVGNIINKMYQDALLNKFNWKDKSKTLKYLERI